MLTLSAPPTPNRIAVTLLGCSLALTTPALARAEITGAESLEWVLTDSDCVVVGKVIKGEQIVGRDDMVYEAVTVAVSRVLKGRPAEHLTVLIRSRHDSDFGKLRYEGLPLLICLVKNDGKRVAVPPDRFPWVLRGDGNWPSVFMLGKSKLASPGGYPAVTRDSDVLTDPDAIVKHAERAIKAAGKQPSLRSDIINVPPDSAAFTLLWAGSSVLLTVPVDAELEALAQRWCGADSAEDRREGAHLLRHFKNAKNVALLKRLLNDPATMEVPKYGLNAATAKSALVYRKRVYYVRRQAFDTLRVFGVKVRQPVLEVLLEGQYEPKAEPRARK